MDQIDFDGMKEKSKVLYESLWKNFNFEDELKVQIEKTWNTRYGKRSNNSYSFCGEGNKEQILIEIFGIDNKDIGIFEEKYDMAVSGDGQEKSRITTLHSSSLCALLHFYNVGHYPLQMELTTQEKTRTVEFTESVFEFKSPVIKGHSPSNIDVVLIGEDDKTREKVLLFLECKFTEYYLSAGKSYSCSKEYGDYFIDYVNEINSKEISVDIKENEAGIGLKTSEDVYLGGIKQIIAHHKGISNVLNGDRVSRGKFQKVIHNYIDQENPLVFLGEILFDFGKSTEVLKKRYEKKYEALATMLNKRCDRIHVLDKVLTYNEIFNNTEKPYNLPSRIKAFYYSK